MAVELRSQSRNLPICSVHFVRRHLTVWDPCVQCLDWTGIIVRGILRRWSFGFNARVLLCDVWEECLNFPLRSIMWLCSSYWRWNVYPGIWWYLGDWGEAGEWFRIGADELRFCSWGLRLGPFLLRQFSGGLGRCLCRPDWSCPLLLCRSNWRCSFIFFWLTGTPRVGLNAWQQIAYWLI